MQFASIFINYAVGQMSTTYQKKFLTFDIKRGICPYRDQEGFDV
jgi:hypothetical protein